MKKEELAVLFHDTYERLAPSFGWITRKNTHCDFSALPDRNKALMLCVCQTILDALKADPPANGSVPANLGTTNNRSDEIALCIKTFESLINCSDNDLCSLCQIDIDAVIAQLRAVR